MERAGRSRSPATPFDLRQARRAALFGGLVADPVFCARALGLGRGRALDQARATARRLLSLRLDAATVALVFGAGQDGGGHVLLRASRDRSDRFEETTARALGAPIRERSPASSRRSIPARRSGSPGAPRSARSAQPDRPLRRGLVPQSARRRGHPRRGRRARAGAARQRGGSRGGPRRDDALARQLVARVSPALARLERARHPRAKRAIARLERARHPRAARGRVVSGRDVKEGLVRPARTLPALTDTC